MPGKVSLGFITGSCSRGDAGCYALLVELGQTSLHALQRCLLLF